MSICFDPFQSIESLYLERRRLCSTGEDNFDEQLAIAIKRLGNAYRMGKQPTIDSAFDRLAYVIQYAPIGMAAIRKLTLSLSEKHLPNSFSILRDEPLRIVSIGAGPGTDLFGFQKEFRLSEWISASNGKHTMKPLGTIFKDK
jgi:hypothetical protein